MNADSAPPKLKNIVDITKWMEAPENEASYFVRFKSLTKRLEEQGVGPICMLGSLDKANTEDGFDFFQFSHLTNSGRMNAYAIWGVIEHAYIIVQPDDSTTNIDDWPVFMVCNEEYVEVEAINFRDYLLGLILKIRSSDTCDEHRLFKPIETSIIEELSFQESEIESYREVRDTLRREREENRRAHQALFQKAETIENYLNDLPGLIEEWLPPDADYRAFIASEEFAAKFDALDATS